MLARKRSAVARHQRRRFVHELRVLLNALGGKEIERDPRVDAALPEVAVERAFVAVLLVQFAEVAQIAAHLLGRDRRILPALPCRRMARYERARAETRFAH